MEAYVYEEEHTNLFVHHDVMLQTYPLSMAWMSTGKNHPFLLSLSLSVCPETDTEGWLG